MPVTVLSQVVFGQNLIQLPDARSAGVGYAMAALKNQGIGHGNPAAQTSSLMRFSYGKPLDLLGMDQYAFSMGVAGRRSQLGFAVSSVGDAVFKQNLLSAQVGHRLGNTTIALRNDLFQFTGENRATRIQYGLTVGSLTRLSEKVYSGIYISNINAISASGPSVALPVRMALGLAYQPNDALLLVAEGSKDVRHNPSFRAGLEYEVVRRVMFRTGVNISTAECYVGTGFRFWKLLTDYSIQYARYRGLVATATATIPLGSSPD
ncbi:MAG: hypothetical protein FJZ78_09880 [Bacteroidetes bacterium]|nr:hypothetical protein [Bacteroidota bacterium]